MPNPRPSAEDRVRAALWFAERGFGVFSVWSANDDGSCRCPLGVGCPQPGKHPVPNIGFKAATTNPDHIRAMLSIPSDPNWGMLPPEGVFALDVDGDGIEKLAELEDELGPLPPTLTTSTAHGRHIFLRWPADLPRPIGQMFGYVTRWGSGAGAGYVIGPRSVHASGAVYAPSGDAYEIAELPRPWATAVVAPPVERRGDEVLTVSPGYQLPEHGFTGSRYDAIRDYIASRYKRGLAREEILAGVLATVAPRFAQALTHDDIVNRFDRAWRGTAERLGQPLSSERPRIVGGGMDAADLLDMDLPPLRWIVPDLIPEGTTILGAPPKVGKSCLIYQLAVETAIGGDFLGRRVTPGSALYLALEDGKRRGQDRLRKALQGRTMPRGRLEVRWNANLIGQGLEEDIAKWIDEHPDATLVAIDTLGKVRPRSTGKQGAYEVDVQDLATLQGLFRNLPVALVIVHHARKEQSDDFLTSVSGTYGITGSADTTLVVKRKRLEAFGQLVVTGRDIADAEIPVRFEDGLWAAAPASLNEASFERAEVFEVIRRRGPVFAKAVADELGKERSNVQHRIDGLVSAGLVIRMTGGYAAVEADLVADSPNTPSHSSHSVTPEASNTPSHSSHSQSDHSDWGERSTRARAREDEPVQLVNADPLGWMNQCRSYTDHTNAHRKTPSGWTCDACYQEGDQE